MLRIRFTKVGRLSVLLWLSAGWVCSVYSSNDISKPVAHFYQVVTDESRQRPIRVDIWFPVTTASECNQQGIDRITCSFSEIRPSKVAILSHGTLGSAMNYSWLTEALAASGMLVLGVSHYGESWIYGEQTVDPVNILKSWQRPQDLSFVLEHYSALPQLSARFDWHSVIAVGHSAGGGTVVALLGARLHWDGLNEYCVSANAAGDKACLYRQSIDPTLAQAANESRPLTDTFKNSRISAAILLDPGPGPLYFRQSLRDITVPVLIFAPTHSDFLKVQNHAEFFHQNLAASNLVWLNNGEGHFVFLDTCDLPLEQFGVPLCRDRPGVDRKESQRIILKDMRKFLDKNTAH